MKALNRARATARKSPVLRRLYHASRPVRKRVLDLSQRAYYTLNRRATPPPSYYLQFVRSSLPVARPSLYVGTEAALKVLPDGQRDFTEYNEDNFLAGEPRFENYDYLRGRVRKEDMGCAALYAFGVPSFQEAQRIFPETTFADQVAAVLGAARRQPSYVADIGCGLGSLSALLLGCGLRVDSVEPSPIAQQHLRRTIERFTGRPLDEWSSHHRFVDLPLGSYMNALQREGRFPDTFLLVEAIEHIPRDEMVSAAEQMRQHGGCRLIVTNAVDCHPIHPDGSGWNHITLVDDGYYDALSRLARLEVLRAGSHLVLDF